RALHAAGFRYRLHDRSLPGTPDLVLPAKRAVVFVHGCFWHGHDCALGVTPGTRTDFWEEKIGRNQARDETAHAALLAAVSTLEPLLAALEDAGVVALTPVGVRSDTFDAAHVEVRLSDGERTLHEARLSLPPALALRLRRVGDQAPGLNLPLPVRLLIEGPRLSPDDLSSLRTGDLLLIPALERAWSARLSVPGGTAVGLFAPASRNFTHQRKESRMTEAAAPPAENKHGLTPGADTPIAVTVDLGETVVPLKTLTELRPGAVLPLTGLDAEMRVTLRSAGQAFARGRLVSLGEAYAVLIDAFSPGSALVTVILLALAPFVAVMVTSFTKIVVVLSLLRTALGMQQSPPNAVLVSLALFLSAIVLGPTWQD
ncbi:hypothetical protein LTR94_027274, partial [Friedmanniomyces endolithicus]